MIKTALLRKKEKDCSLLKMMQESCETAFGMKLRNPFGTNLCYLNTVINCVAVNKTFKALALGSEVGQRKLAEEDVLTELKNILRLQNMVGNFPPKNLRLNFYHRNCLLI